MRRAAFALVLGLALAGCHSHTETSSGHQTAPSNPHRAQLVAAAHLPPCPASAASAPSSGLPNVTLQCLGAGPAVRMGGLAGKPLVLNLWGSWCTPCQAEAAYLSAAQRADRAKVAFLGVDIVDDPDSALDFGAHVDPPVRYPSVQDPDRKFAIALGIASPPATIFVSAAGRVVHTEHGAYRSTSQLQHDIATYLHVST